MKTLLEVLVELRKYMESTSPDSEVSSMGICWYVPKVLRGQLKDLMNKWPLSTGNMSYPVPASRNNKSVGDARDSYWMSTKEQIWFVGEYAELRMELLNWMIEELQDEINLPIR